MKKFFMIVVLFCAATLISSAEAIKDKDFEDFFNGMVRDVKSKQAILDDFINGDFIAKQSCKNEYGRIRDIISTYEYFKETFNKNFNSVTKLSSKNNYHFEINRKIDFEITLEESDEYYKERYGTGKIYKLSLHTGPHGDAGGPQWCVFIQVYDELNKEYNGYIVDFESVG